MTEIKKMKAVYYKYAHTNKKIMDTPYKKIFAVLFVGFLFFNFTPTSLATTACTKENAETCCAKTYGTYLVDTKGCNKDPYCISNNALFTQCSSKTSEQGQKIVSLNCPSGSYPYTPDASDSVLRNFLSELDKSVFGTTGLGDPSSNPHGCLNDKQGGTCSDKNRQALDADKKPIGCWVAPTGVIRQKDINEENGSVFYNTLNALYGIEMDWTKSLLPPSKVNEYRTIVNIPCDNSITNIIGGVDCAKTKTYTNSLPLYVTRLYQFGFGIVGAVALLMIIIGAAKYTLAAGSFTSKDDAKKQITESIYGLLLLFGAYLILNIINPNLLKAPTIEQVSVTNLSTQTSTQIPTNTPAESLGVNPPPNCLIAGPATTLTAKESSCTTCNIGYTLTSEGKCVDNCGGGRHLDSSGKCVCETGYVYTEFTGKCIPE